MKCVHHPAAPPRARVQQWVRSCIAAGTLLRESLLRGKEFVSPNIPSRGTVAETHFPESYANSHRNARRNSAEPFYSGPKMIAIRGLNGERFPDQVEAAFGEASG